MTSSGVGGPAAGEPATPAVRDALELPLLPASSHDDDSLLPDKVDSLMAQTGVSLFGHLLGASATVWLFVGHAPLPMLLGWGLLFLLVFSLRMLLRVRYRRAEAIAPEAARKWLRLWDLGALGSGAVWGLAAWMLYVHGDTAQRAALIVIGFSFSAASIAVLAPQFGTFLGFTSLILLPMLARIGTLGGDNWQLALVLALAFVMILSVGRVYRATFDSMVALKVRSAQLAAQLQREKAAAEAARREAETANRAKTQFFAAASHDLRQPLHAMGLFAEALRAKSRGDEEVTHLVNSINSSVDALEGLFSELLDITKIDTGGVEPQPQHFALRELFARIALQYEPTAFEKGLALRLRGHQQVVHADPVLVDRVVRNLVANAIRYTSEGGVLVGARRRGDRVLIQVWDSGSGIAPAEQQRIFDEFYQVPGSTPATAHERKGLGLGLSIVKRLAAMMDAPLALRSQRGRGSVFSISLPAGRTPRTLAGTPPAARVGLGVTLDHRRILVVEDEPAVREGLAVLLKGWGASVHAFENTAAAEAWAAAAVAAGPEALPDLLIVDFRLPEGTGVDALLTLRRTLARPDLPAIMVTGSTMTGHEADAHRHDFHLLLKPVVPNKLRAMIAFKLGLR
ncbi:ATP-binding response regulator [Rivibacter subsaxonicus]|uniref:histidine kinase n=1 Tax=Rivibacter subsaxonicus TaxID=457575 RepID=A0A4Q7VH65_9BURK|nr:hybrid sensor histidine kinase/response regulator [Rivibacter subsaxonicus]RZT95377.1 signal transduction histidine kinase [Rivibacter subsaxonicus]